MQQDSDDINEATFTFLFACLKVFLKWLIKLKNLHWLPSVLQTQRWDATLVLCLSLFLSLCLASIFLTAFWGSGDFLSVQTVEGTKADFFLWYKVNNIHIFENKNMDDCTTSNLSSLENENVQCTYTIEM